jgi:hypothetical protein
MRASFFVALALFVVLGALRDARSELQPYNVNYGWHGTAMCDATFASLGCEGIKDLFAEHPVPIGAIDEDTGREIMGWEIICDDELVNWGGITGTGSEDHRDVPRAFGTIRIHYVPRH